MSVPSPLTLKDYSAAFTAPPPLPIGSGQIGVIIQGPIQTDIKGRATREVVEALARSPLRNRLFVVYAMWEDEPAALIERIVPFVDHVTFCKKPARPGSCHRNFQATAVHQGLQELEHRGIAWALKTRSDLMLSDQYLSLLIQRAETPDYHQILVTNLFTRYEPFHISDMVVFSSTANLLDWYNPVPVFYEDLFSPEVQFARLFVRARNLPYPMTLTSYLRFLRDWIELVDFYEQGLLWFKNDAASLQTWNRVNFIMYDRDAGPVITRLISVPFHRSLHNKVQGLNLIATYLMIIDALQRYIYTVLPGFRRRHCAYTVDNQGKEHDKVIRNQRLSTTLTKPQGTTTNVSSHRNGQTNLLGSPHKKAQEAKQ